MFLGIPEGTDVLVEPIVGAGPPGRHVRRADTVQGLPDGRHAVVFGTTDDSQSVVVERAITRTIEGIPTTSVLPGGVSRAEDGYIPNTWTLAVGPGEPTEDALVVYNTTSADATVTVQAVTADGVVTVAVAGRGRPARRGDHHDPAHRPGGHRQPAGHPLDRTGVRRALAAPRAGRPGAQRVLGRPGRRLSDVVRHEPAADRRWPSSPSS